MECANSGTLTVDGDVEPCQIGLYTVTLSNDSTRRDFPMLCGVTDNGRTLNEEACKALLALPVKDFTEDGSRSPHWLKRGGAAHPLEKQATQLRRELLKGQESQFFDAMRLDVELEEQVKVFAEQEKLTAKITREFVIRLEEKQ